MTESEFQDVTRASGSNDSQPFDRSIHQPNDVLGGRYRVISMLGKGGMGIVYRVEQVFLGKEFALKTIDKRLLSDATTRRFRHEARATFAVDHPNIVSVHDYGLLDDQTPFLAMELVYGKTLSDVLRIKTRLSVQEALPIFVQVCLGLAHAHKSGVVHRDIKPSNIMLIDGAASSTEGSIKILDFGIAKFTHHEAGEMQALTKTGEIFGSPLYMSPEQCAGTRVDHRSDIYSLGCVFYEALTGTPPFAGENVLATMLMHQSEKVLSLKEASLGEEFPPELEKIILTMLAKRPDERYQNLGVAANDLAALLRGDASQISVMSVIPNSEVESKTSTVTVKKSDMLLQMAGIAILSALASAAITHFLESNPAQSDSASTLIEHLPKLTDNILTAPVGPDYKLGKPEQKRVDMSKIDNITSISQTMKEASIQLSNRLTNIRLHDSTISKEVLELLSKYPHVHGVDFMDCEVSNKDLGLLSKLPIVRISLITSNFDDIGAEQLSKCSKLDTIKASSTSLTDAGLKHLAKLQNLRQLKIDNTRVSVKGVSLLCQHPSFKKIFLSRCERIGPEERRWLTNKFPLANFDFKDD